MKGDHRRTDRVFIMNGEVVKPTHTDGSMVYYHNVDTGREYFCETAWFDRVAVEDNAPAVLPDETPVVFDDGIWEGKGSICGVFTGDFGWAYVIRLDDQTRRNYAHVHPYKTLVIAEMFVADNSPEIQYTE